MKMTLGLRIVLGMVCLFFLGFVVKSVRSEKMLLKYSILWMSFAFAGILMAIFPEVVYSLAFLSGFETPSNFVFFACLFLMMLICLSLSSVASRQDRQIKALVQELSIEKVLNKQLDKNDFSIQNEIPCDHAGHGE